MGLSQGECCYKFDKSYRSRRGVRTPYFLKMSLSGETRYRNALWGSRPKGDRTTPIKEERDTLRQKTKNGWQNKRGVMGFSAGRPTAANTGGGGSPEEKGTENDLRRRATFPE